MKINKYHEKSCLNGTVKMSSLLMCKRLVTQRGSLKVFNSIACDKENFETHEKYIGMKNVRTIGKHHVK